jgi:hypothetical protein
MSRKSPDRVHLAGPVRPFAVCGSSDASERHTRVLEDVNCPFCSALYLAEHPEYVIVPPEPV